MSEKNSCPGCGRHCDLSRPHCEIGEEYSRTGKISQQRHEKKQDHKMHMAHDHTADINDQLIINLRDLSHIMRFLYEGKAGQKRILMILNESETLTQRELTEHLGIQPGSASEILTKLESAGLIIRTRNEADRRTTDISLTDAGREFAAEALAQRQKRQEEMFSCLSQEEKQELLSLLEKVCADWRIRYSESGHRHGHGHEQHHQQHNGRGGHDGHGYHGGFHRHGGS